MSELNERYWLETDDFLFSTEKTLKNLIKAYSQLSFHTLIHHRGPLLQPYQNWKILHKTYFCKIPSQMHKTQYPDYSDTNREVFLLNIGINPIVVDE